MGISLAPDAALADNTRMNEKADHETICRKFLADLDGMLDWSWDGRFDCTVAAFKAADEKKVAESLAQNFSGVWRSDTIAQAPAGVAKMAKKMDLRSGQVLYATELSAGLAFASWWPWGNGQTISVRIICPGIDTSLLKSWFNIG